MILGVDYSITTPCVCALAADGTFANSRIHFLTQRKRDLNHASTHITCEAHLSWTTEEGRYDHISNTIIQFIQTQCPSSTETSELWLEGYALGAKGKVFNISEATGLFKHKVHSQLPHIQLRILAPTALKKWATQRGNATKEQMLAAWRREGNDIDLLKWWHDFRLDHVGNPVSDIVDAYWLAKYGYAQHHPI